MSTKPSTSELWQNRKWGRLQKRLVARTVPQKALTALGALIIAEVRLDETAFGQVLLQHVLFAAANPDALWKGWSPTIATRLEAQVELRPMLYAVFAWAITNDVLKLSTAFSIDYATHGANKIATAS